MSQPSSFLSSRSRVTDISEQYLKQLGRVVVTSSRLESTSASIAAAMRVDRHDHVHIDSTLAAVQERIESGMPPWTGVSADELGRWTAMARHLLDERTRLFDALSDHHFSGSDGDAVRMMSADGSVVAADERFIDRFLTRIHRHDVIGNDLTVRLEYVDTKGTNWPLSVWHLEYRDPEKAASMDWYAEHLTQLPKEWRLWLDDGAAPAAAPVRKAKTPRAAQPISTAKSAAAAASAPTADAVEESQAG